VAGICKRGCGGGDELFGGGAWRRGGVFTAGGLGGEDLGGALSKGKTKTKKDQHQQ
jgi:hypothetical protein